jgi:hypothetical protein
VFHKGWEFPGQLNNCQLYRKALNHEVNQLYVKCVMKDIEGYKIINNLFGKFRATSM